MGTILEVKDLVKRYGSLVAVDGVTFGVDEGEIFGILGPNGAGKTTTVEMIEGLRNPDAGSIMMLGIDAARGRQEIRELIGVQLQSTMLYPRIRVAEALELFGSYYRRAIPAAQLLDELALTEKKDTFVERLSGGQRQRLALALALVNDPKVLFLDEPTSGLDPQARRKLWGIIGQLGEKGKTVILTTHYMEEAEQLCRRVAIMDHGKIIALDTPNALIAETGLEATVEIDHPGDELRKALEEAGLPARVTETAGKLVLHTSESSRVVSQLTGIADDLGVVLQDLTVRKATLEDVFLALTGRHLRE